MHLFQPGSHMTKHSPEDTDQLELSYQPQHKTIKLSALKGEIDTDTLISQIQTSVESHPDSEILDLTSLKLETFSQNELYRVLAQLPVTLKEVLLDDSYSVFKGELLHQVNPEVQHLVLVFENKKRAEESTDVFQLSKNLNDSNAKITWVRESNQHAILLVEMLEKEQHKVYKVHLRGDLVVRNPFNLLKGRFFWGMHYRDGRVEVKDLTDKAIHVAEILTEWTIDKDKALRLIDYAKRKEHEKQYFNLLGEGAISSMFMATVANQLSHSCVTWSREALLHAGINVPLSQLINLATITSLEAKGAKDHPMDASGMARLARVNEHQTIQDYYPKQQSTLSAEGYVDPNSILHRVSRGPVEFVLGIYSPFMLAASYGHIDTINTLMRGYGANPYVNVHSKFCFGILGRYSAFDCAQSLMFRPYISREEQQQTLSTLKTIDHKKMMLDALERYIQTREKNPDYQTTIGFFGLTVLNLGYSRQQKIEAATAFKNALEGNDSAIDSKFQGALNQGELGKLFKDYKRYSGNEPITFVRHNDKQTVDIKP